MAMAIAAIPTTTLLPTMITGTREWWRESSLRSISGSEVRRRAAVMASTNSFLILSLRELTLSSWIKFEVSTGSSLKKVKKNAFFLTLLLRNCMARSKPSRNHKMVVMLSPSLLKLRINKLNSKQRNVELS